VSTNDTFYCPRRDDMLSWLGKFSPIFDPAREGTDTWRTLHSKEPSCSYCGSIKPERLFQIIEEGGEIGPTDKGYKFYTHEKGTGVCSYCKGTGKHYPFGNDPTLTDEERATVQECSFCRSTGKGANGAEHKFYLQHFSQADRTRYIDLHNAGSIAYGYPGYLYSGLYFARKSP
jgi:hypothetical protein